jgi:alanyl-tRNA synthetase
MRKFRTHMTTPQAQQWPAVKVRQTFVDFFCKEHGHVFIPSSKVVPERDPTLLFTNAGMNQFKPLFLGQADPSTDFGKLKRVANSQKCIRAGGKHNDLDDVGKDTYHHTFFEMLGNWSFGDYFKEEAINMAWTLLTKVYGIQEDRLYVTYFEGNEKAGLPADEEARSIWSKLVPANRILKGNMKDNFWEMGDTGPCGPCTEIHYDRLGGRDAAHLVNNDDPMVIEIWNNVFMQFNREADGSLQPLPAKHVDTGMGFERITSILQGVLSNYDTDIWSSIFKKIQLITGCPQAYDYVGPDKSNDIVVAYRVVADHIRTITTALIDGATPDSTGRGYVLRRVIRRAIRFGHEFLGAKEGFFSQLVDAVSESLGDFFPELRVEMNVRRAKAIITEEEASFAQTYSQGLKHFNEVLGKTAANAAISGNDAFVLHDRYGFPLDLTILMAEGASRKVNVKEFNDKMDEHKKEAGGKMKAAGSFLDGYALDEMRKRSIVSTNDQHKYLWDNPIKAKVLVVYSSGASSLVPSTAEAAAGPIGIILDATNFYAESGGQIFDIGTLTTDDGAVFQVDKVLNFGGYVCHIGTVKKGEIKANSTVTSNVDYGRRRLVASNHTATHELNRVLRDVLQYGHPESFTEVNQKGSYVSDEVLRFDFSWNAKVEVADLASIEAALQKGVTDDLKVYTKEIPVKQAMDIKSIRCMFDEKYGDVVKVVSIGIPVEEILANPGDEARLKQYSIELCGGTHVTSLKEIGNIVICGEDALMKGVRRMTIVTGNLAKKAADEGKEFEAKFTKLMAMDCGGEHDDLLKALSVLTKEVNDSSIPLLMKAKLRDNIDAAVKQTNQAKKDYAVQMTKAAEQFGQQFVASLPANANYAIVPPQSNLPPTRDALQTIGDLILKARPGIAVMVIGADVKKNTGLIMSYGSKGVNAVEWVKHSTGKGGGKPAQAQGGFQADQLTSVLAKAAEFAKQSYGES